ncbi:MAG: acetamidase/formamidase family protein [Treponema sp.]|nr:acetamidase/formamidase family protein [Treponema sp.]
MRTIDPNGKYCFVFSRYEEPVAKVELGEEITLLTEDAYSSLIQSENDNLAEIRRKRKGPNPQTGPLYIEGAEAGDTLKVHIIDIEPGRDWAVSNIHSFFGGLTPNKFTRMINVPFNDRIYIYRFDKEGMMRHDDFLRFPWKPFMGTIATAPPMEAISTATPFEHGGNMDCPDVKPGNIIYLPVAVDGAYFFTGDCHAAQGEGELCGTALEITAKVKLKFEVIKGKQITWPRIESPDEYMVVGSARPMEDAARIAYAELIEWMTEFGWDKMDAYQALTHAGKLYCANMVDPNYSMVAKVSKSLAERRL